METLKAIALRKSTRAFSQKAVPDDARDLLLGAAGASPVGMRDYDSLRLTYVTDKSVIEAIEKAAGRQIYYGAPAVLIISADEKKPPFLTGANAACVATTALFAATDIGVDSVYIYGIVPAFEADKSLHALAQIPEGYTPAASIALGYAEQPDGAEKNLKVLNIAANIVK
jgi:nitroreductase